MLLRNQLADVHAPRIKATKQVQRSSRPLALITGVKHVPRAQSRLNIDTGLLCLNSQVSSRSLSDRDHRLLAQACFSGIKHRGIRSRVTLTFESTTLQSLRPLFLFIRFGHYQLSDVVSELLEPVCYPGFHRGAALQTIRTSRLPFQVAIFLRALHVCFQNAGDKWHEEQPGVSLSSFFGGTSHLRRTMRMCRVRLRRSGTLSTDRPFLKSLKRPPSVELTSNEQRGKRT